MPRLSEAKKDVISCEKLRLGANNLSAGDFRMGQPTRGDPGIIILTGNEANPQN